MVKLFYVRFNYRPRRYFRSDILFRTDFMGDMAYIAFTRFRDNTDSSLLSFGGGFELMEAGGDKDGIWSILKSGMQYVTIPSASSLYLIPFFSIGAILSHVPYVIEFMMSAMGGGDAMKRATEFSERSVLKRLETGANKKDLFYYLVRQYIVYSTCSFY